MKASSSNYITQSSDNILNENNDNDKGMYDKLTMYIFTLESSLQEANSQIDLLESENQMLKRDKQNLMASLQRKESENQDMSTKMISHESHIRNLQSKIKDLEQSVNDLTYKNIEMKSKLDSQEHNKESPNVKTNNVILELEITKEKLLFDNLILKNKLNEMTLQYDNDKQLEEFSHKNEITQYQKTIDSLQQTLNDIEIKVSSNIENVSKMNNDNNSTLLIEQISILQNQIKKLNEDNYELQKSNQDLKFLQSENEITYKHKENLITSLQNELEDIKKFYEMKLSEAKVNTEDIENKMRETQQQLEQLFNEREVFSKENEEYKNEISKLYQESQNVIEEFNQKLQKFQNAINEYKQKIKEYKSKIISLKIKIKELHNEIDILKRNDKLMFDTLDNFTNKSMFSPIKSQYNVTNNECIYDTITNPNYIYADTQEFNK